MRSPNGVDVVTTASGTVASVALVAAIGQRSLGVVVLPGAVERAGVAVVAVVGVVAVAVVDRRAVVDGRAADEDGRAGDDVVVDGMLVSVST